MRYDKDDWRRVAEKKAQKYAVDTAAQDFPEYLRQAAVRSELLTKDPHWDIYLTRIQENVNKLQVALAAAQAKLESPEIWDSTELHRIKAVALECRAMIRAFNIAISYPKAIIDAHRESTKEAK